MTPPTLKQLIEKATPGVWSVKSTDEGRAYTKNWREISPGVVSASSYTTNRYGETEVISGVSISDANAQLIARCSPAVMLAVASALELSIAVKQVAMLEQVHDHQGVQEVFSKHLVTDLQMLGRKAIEASQEALNLLNGKAP